MFELLCIYRFNNQQHKKKEKMINNHDHLSLLLEKWSEVITVQKTLLKQSEKELERPEVFFLFFTQCGKRNLQSPFLLSLLSKLCILWVFGMAVWKAVWMKSCFQTVLWTSRKYIRCVWNIFIANVCVSPVVSNTKSLFDVPELLKKVKYLVLFVLLYSNKIKIFNKDYQTQAGLGLLWFLLKSK